MPRFGLRCERWRDAIAAAGLDYEKVRLVREAYTRKEVIALLIGHILLSRSVTWNDAAHTANMTKRREDQ